MLVLFLKTYFFLMTFNPYFTGYSSNAPFLLTLVLDDNTFNPYFTGYSSNAGRPKNIAFSIHTVPC